MRDEHRITDRDDIVANKSSQDQTSAIMLYDTASANIEAQQSCAGILTTANLVQNVAYKPITVSLSPNVAYEPHMHVHQGTEYQDEYDYI